jgi:hypothetical protein
VRWLDRHALVTLPEHLEQSFATAVGEQLLAIIDGDVLVLILSPSGASGGQGGRDRDLIGETTDRLSGVVRILEESAGQASAPLAGQLRRAIEELDAIIQAARTSITPITPPRRTGEEDA